MSEARTFPEGLRPPPLPHRSPEAVQAVPGGEESGPGVAPPSTSGPDDQTVSFAAPKPRSGETLDVYLARVGEVAQKIIAEAGCDAVTTMLPLGGLQWRPWWYRARKFWQF